MSDLLGATEFHRCDLYHECYRPRPTEHRLPPAHRENIYRKLGVTNRTAAVATIRAGPT